MELLPIGDPASGLRAVLAIDSTVEGRAFGGIRVDARLDAAAAEREARALARAMTLKAAFAGLPGGGAKTVVYAWRDRTAAMRALGRFVESLRGRYLCGGDMGFGDADAAAVREETDYYA